MRHKKSFNHLGRTASHRKAMLSNMAISLIMHKRITTTLAKAKELKKFVEPLITKSKEDTTNSRRVVFSYLQNKEAIIELFGTISEKVAERPGGYTRISSFHYQFSSRTSVHCIMHLVLYPLKKQSCSGSILIIVHTGSIYIRQFLIEATFRKTNLSYFS